MNPNFRDFLERASFTTLLSVLCGVIVVFALLIIRKSIHKIGPLEVGLIRKNFSLKKLSGSCPIAFNGEAGYQAELLTPGLRFQLWPLYSVTKYPWVQIPTDGVGVVVAQIGEALKQGELSAIYKPTFGSFLNLKAFLDNGGQRGIQRPTLQPGTVAPMHPIAFMVLSSVGVYGEPIGDEFKSRKDRVKLEDFGLKAGQLKLVTVDHQDIANVRYDAIGIVTVLDGAPLEPGDIACRLGGWQDIADLLGREGTKGSDVIEAILANKNARHQNYQDMQAFFDAGGRRGLQHDPLMPGRYALNPFLVGVEIAPMLEIMQGEVAVVKAFVGLKTEDISGADFKHGNIVRPGRRGLWEEPLRTGKFAINPRLYETEKVPTAILTLNWSERTGEHGLDEKLQAINAKSSEGFDFKLDLQVQIHVADINAPRVISAVGSVANLIHEVMRPAVGNFFRNKLQSQSATTFISERSKMQAEATTYVSDALSHYNVEVRGVYIQEVQLPAELVDVLQKREIAAQSQITFDRQREAEGARANLEKAKGTADAQHKLANTAVLVDVAKNEADIVMKRADGTAYETRTLGEAEASKIEKIGEATGKAYTKQKEAIGAQATALVNVAKAVGEGNIKIVPDILVVGGGSGGVEGLAATLMGYLTKGATPSNDAKPLASAPTNGATTPAS